MHIVMVRLGPCSISSTVRLARTNGAHAVIVVDAENSTLTSEQLKNLIVADDGLGVESRVPSLLISNADGAPLIKAAKTEAVLVELSWSAPSKHVVAVDFWMSTGSREATRFLQEFSPKRKTLNEDVSFIPHYHVFSMEEEADFAQESELCTSADAKYCTEDPDGAGPVTGKMVLFEDVRQLCIHGLPKIPHEDAKRLDAQLGQLSDILQNPLGTEWKHLTNSDKKTSPDERPTVRIAEYSKKYWDYIERFPDECPLDADEARLAERKFGPECSYRLMEAVHINVEEIRMCENSTAEEKLQYQLKRRAWSPRALRINGWRYAGDLDAELVTRAICSGFVQQPPQCRTLLRPMNPINAAAVGGVGVSAFLGTLGAVLLLVLLGLCLYRRYLTKHVHARLREEVMLEVQAQMGNYSSLGQ